MTRTLKLALFLSCISPGFVFSQEPLVPVLSGDAWGYGVEGSTRLKIPAQFERAGKFSAGLAPVKIGDKFGFINTNGNPQIKAKFDLASSFSEGLAAVSVGGKFGYIDAADNWVIKPQYEWAGDVRNGLALVMVERKYRFINRTNNPLLPEDFSLARPFSGGIAAVANEPGQFFLINTKGARVGNSTFADVGTFHEDLAWVKTRKGTYGFINKQGDLQFPAIYNGLGNYNRGLAAARLKNNKWCLINKSGTPVTDVKYDEIQNGPDQIIVREGNKVEIATIDANGDIQTAPTNAPWMKDVRFETDPDQAAIYKPPLIEYELEPANDKSRLLIPEYLVSKGNTNLSDLLDSRQEYMILFVIPDKPIQPRKCIPGIDNKVFAKFPP